ncbi:MAG: formyltransferase family protein [Planctomycetota bacterium]
MPRETRRTSFLAMLSGGGRTLMNLLDAIDDGRLDARVGGVVASRECPGADRARDRGLRVAVETGEIPAERLCELAGAADAEWIVLCGYLRRVAIPREPGQPCDFSDRVVNIHPALLPRHGGPGMYGERVHRAVLEAGDAHSGCTVHLCDDRYDTGPILRRARCPVLPDDTPDSLAARVFALECEAYPAALQELFAASA